MGQWVKCIGYQNSSLSNGHHVTCPIDIQCYWYINQLVCIAKFQWNTFISNHPLSQCQESTKMKPSKNQNIFYGLSSHNRHPSQNISSHVVEYAWEINGSLSSLRKYFNYMHNVCCQCAEIIKKKNVYFIFCIIKRFSCVELHIDGLVHC